MDKDAIRKEIDSIDTKILDLLTTRIACAKEIGKMKSEKGEAIYVPSREKQVFENLMEKNGGRIEESALKAIYREIISASISAEKKTDGQLSRAKIDVYPAGCDEEFRL